MQATFNFEFGDLADVTAGNPRTAAPLANSERSRKTRREVFGVVMGGRRGLIVEKQAIFQSEHQDSASRNQASSGRQSIQDAPFMQAVPALPAKATEPNQHFLIGLNAEIPEMRFLAASDWFNLPKPPTFQLRLESERHSLKVCDLPRNSLSL